MLSHTRTPHQERTHGSRGRRGAHRAGRNAYSTPATGVTWAHMGQPAADTAPRTGGLQPVPIVEVGTRVRASDGQYGIVLDVQDDDGPLTYLVQLDGQTTGQLMPAHTLKGAQI